MEDYTLSELRLLKEDVKEAYDKGVFENHIFKNIAGFLGVNYERNNGQAIPSLEKHNEKTKMTMDQPRRGEDVVIDCKRSYKEVIVGKSNNESSGNF